MAFVCKQTAILMVCINATGLFLISDKRQGHFLSDNDMRQSRFLNSTDSTDRESLSPASRRGNLSRGGVSSFMEHP